jgi:hypothetical protein
MNKLEAIQAMKNGFKVTNIYFSDDEYLHMVNGVIRAEDGINFEDWLFDGVKWKEDGWSIKNIYNIGVEQWDLMTTEEQEYYINENKIEAHYTHNIADILTRGFGKMDFNGFWEYQCKKV